MTRQYLMRCTNQAALPDALFQPLTVVQENLTRVYQDYKKLQESDGAQVTEMARVVS